MEQAVQEKEEFGRILRVQKETTQAEESVRPTLPLPLTPPPNPEPNPDPDPDPDPDSDSDPHPD